MEGRKIKKAAEKDFFIGQWKVHSVSNDLVRILQEL